MENTSSRVQQQGGRNFSSNNNKQKATSTSPMSRHSVRFADTRRGGGADDGTDGTSSNASSVPKGRIAELKAALRSSFLADESIQKSWHGKNWDDDDDDSSSSSEEEDEDDFFDADKSSNDLDKSEHYFRARAKREMDQSSTFSYWNNIGRDVPKDLQSKNRMTGVTQNGVSRKRIADLKNLLQKSVLNGDHVSLKDNVTSMSKSCPATTTSTRRAAGDAVVRAKSPLGNTTNNLLNVMVNASQKHINSSRTRRGSIFVIDDAKFGNTRVVQVRLEKAANKIQRFIRNSLHILRKHNKQRRYLESELDDTERRRQEELNGIQQWIQEEKERFRMELEQERSNMDNDLDVMFTQDDWESFKITSNFLREQIAEFKVENQKIQKEHKELEHEYESNQLEALEVDNPEREVERTRLEEEIAKGTKDVDDWNRLILHYKKSIDEANAQAEAMAEKRKAKRAERKKIEKTIRKIIELTKNQQGEENPKLVEKITKLKKRRDRKIRKLKEQTTKGNMIPSLGGEQTATEEAGKDEKSEKEGRRSKKSSSSRRKSKKTATEDLPDLEDMDREKSIMEGSSSILEDKESKSSKAQAGDDLPDLQDMEEAQTQREEVEEGNLMTRSKSNGTPVDNLPDLQEMERLQNKKESGSSEDKGQEEPKLSTSGGATEAQPMDNEEGKEPKVTIHSLVEQATGSAKDFVAGRDEKFEDIYTLGKRLGEGAFGEVFVCTHKKLKVERAVKVIDKNQMSEWEYDDVIKEFQMLTQIDNQNVIRVYEFYDTDDTFYIVQELAKGGELYDELEKHGKLKEQDVALLMKNILACTDYLAHNRIIHRDINLENVLLEEPGNYEKVKLIDFGLAAKCEEGQKLFKLVGKANYLAPEVLGDDGYDLAYDVWSCGVLAAVLLTGYFPFDSDDDMDIYNQIVEGAYINYDSKDWNGISAQAKSFVKKLLAFKAVDRPTAGEALQHAWITGNTDDSPATGEVWTASTMESVKPQQIAKSVKPKKPEQPQNDSPDIIMPSLVEEGTGSAKDFAAGRDEKFEDVYTLGQRLGEGAFGEVFVCTHNQLKVERAVKVIDKNQMSEWEYEDVIKEFQMLTKCDNPNVIRAYEFYDTDDTFYIVQELAQGGELYDELEKHGKLKEQDVALLMKQILGCTKYLADQRIVHRDINMENILLEESGNYSTVKLIDFGLADRVEEGQKLYQLVGKPRYLAPEVLGDDGYGLGYDIWSCGIVAALLLTGYFPFDSDSHMDIYNQITEGAYINYDGVDWQGISDQAKAFVKSLLTFDAEKRPTAAEALEHPWITGNTDKSKPKGEVWCAATPAKKPPLKDEAREDTSGMDRLSKILARAEEMRRQSVFAKKLRVHGETRFNEHSPMARSKPKACAGNMKDKLLEKCRAGDKVHEETGKESKRKNNNKKVHEVDEKDMRSTVEKKRGSKAPQGKQRRASALMSLITDMEDEQKEFESEEKNEETDEDERDSDEEEMPEKTSKSSGSRRAVKTGAPKQRRASALMSIITGIDENDDNDEEKQEDEKEENVSNKDGDSDDDHRDVIAGAPKQRRQSALMSLIVG